MALPYAERAAKVMALYLTDYTEKELLAFGEESLRARRSLTIPPQ